MYLPAHFREDDPAILRRVMTEHSFGTLVTFADDEPVAGHLPFLHRDDGSPHGQLLAHMARANPQWRQLEAGQRALVVFHGPHAYVSPSWYVDPINVPTWNYVVVHAYGRATLLSPDELRATLGELVDANERRLESPWSMTTLPEDLVTRLLGGIVGLRIDIERLEGKLKLGQNRDMPDRERAAERLAAQQDAPSRDTAAWMTELLRRAGSRSGRA